MKKIFISIFVVFGIQLNLNSQQWNQSYAGYSQGIVDVKFINADTGYTFLYGNSGNVRIMKTTNKAISWSEVFNASYGGGGSIEMLTADEGFVYYDNKVKRTTNSFASTNDVLTLPSNSQFYRIKFINSMTGFVLYSKPNSPCGVSIYKSTNAGNTWDITSINGWLTANYPSELRDLCASPNDQNIIYVCGFSRNNYNTRAYVLWKSTDKFNSVTQLFTDPPAPDFLCYNSPIPFSSGLVAYAGNNGTYLNQGGNFWHTASSSCSGVIGLCFSDATRGFLAGCNNVYFSNDEGNNWTSEGSIGNIEYSRMNSFGDVAYIGVNNGILHYRQLTGINVNSNFDWRVNPFPYLYSTTIDGQQYLTPAANVSVRGGTLATALSDRFVKSNGDTTAQFYYWGGNCDVSMNPNKTYFIYKPDVNADYKTQLMSNDAEALKYSPQTKAVKDAYGVTNLVYESMGGIFFTRNYSPNFDKFKTEEVVSGTGFPANNYGYATFNNKNPYITEILPSTGNSGEVHGEENIAAVWEQRNGNSVQIYYSDRENYQRGWRTIQLGTNLTMTNVPQNFNSFPKVMEAGQSFNTGTYYSFVVVTYLQYNEANQKTSLRAKIFYGANHDGYQGEDQELIGESDISDYSIAYTYSPTCFSLHVAYKRSGSIWNDHFNIYQNGTPGSDRHQEVSSGDGQVTRNKPDITLRNATNNNNNIDKQPVVTYQAQSPVRIILPNGTDYITSTYYPIIIKERSSSGSWANTITYNSLAFQENPNIEGSKTRNSYIVNYSQNGNTFLQKVPRWENATTGYNCYPPSITPIQDVKFVRGGLSDQTSTLQHVMVLSGTSTPYTLERRNCQIVSNQIVGDGDFDGVYGVVVTDHMQYSFNLGSIMINSNPVYFSTNLDSVNQLNNFMHSNNFFLTNNDTLVLGRDAYYIPADTTGVFAGIEYWIDLVSSTTARVKSTLIHDTLHVADSIHLEYLDGFVISDIEGGSDSFYVQLRIDSLFNSTTIGGGLVNNGDGGNGSLGKGNTKKIFWHDGRKETVRNIPAVFNLYQNYPNPFNPVTTIKYDLPKDVNVTIKVYDILGKEVTRLVNNEFKQAGVYQLLWNANNYASGVYVCRIQAGDYVSIKKMVLLK